MLSCRQELQEGQECTQAASDNDAPAQLHAEHAATRSGLQTSSSLVMESQMRSEAKNMKEFMDQKQPVQVQLGALGHDHQTSKPLGQQQEQCVQAVQSDSENLIASLTACKQQYTELEATHGHLTRAHVELHETCSQLSENLHAIKQEGNGPRSRRSTAESGGVDEGSWNTAPVFEANGRAPRQRATPAGSQDGISQQLDELSRWDSSDGEPGVDAQAEKLLHLQAELQVAREDLDQERRDNVQFVREERALRAQLAALQPIKVEYV
jgi:hypothetical protein